MFLRVLAGLTQLHSEGWQLSWRRMHQMLHLQTQTQVSSEFFGAKQYTDDDPAAWNNLCPHYSANDPDTQWE